MKGVILWLSGAALAFLLTSGAFLLLANASGGPSEKSLRPDSPSAESGPALDLQLGRDYLSSLKQRPDQKLSIGVHNAGSQKLSDINVSVKVYSENTALSDVRYYRSSIKDLAAGETVTADFTLDLSFAGQNTDQGAEPARAIIEVRAATPSGVSSVRTAILPA
ncbi:MAG TPA: hypothetical protein VFJ72_13795 [Rubrobacteraceae bacterium]|nr:hypothetical protein [Rubrobacteraceae bacterium]